MSCACAVNYSHINYPIFQDYKNQNKTNSAMLTDFFSIPIKLLKFLFNMQYDLTNLQKKTSAVYPLLLRVFCTNLKEISEVTRYVRFVTMGTTANGDSYSFHHLKVTAFEIAF